MVCNLFKTMKTKALLLLICILGGLTVSNAQKKLHSDAYHMDYMYGKIIRHSPQILHLIQGPTQGIMFSWERKTYGEKAWQELYNYPSYGASFLIQDMGSPELGRIYSLHGEYRFFFWQRKLHLKTGVGVGYVPKKYNAETNPRNSAYGSTLTASILFGLEYQIKHIFGSLLNLKFGTFLVHYSNGKTKSPNTSTNNFGVQLGLSHEFSETDQSYTSHPQVPLFKTWNWDIMLASGANDSGIWNVKNEAFLTLGTSINKRLSQKSSLNFGVEAFLFPSVKTYIQYQAAAYSEEQTYQGDEDWKRVGLFLGHELYLGKWSVLTHIGYYAYYPVNYQTREYIKVGLRHYINDKLFVSLALKSHYSKAEAVEYGIGIRL